MSLIHNIATATSKLSDMLPSKMLDLNSINDGCFCQWLCATLLSRNTFTTKLANHNNREEYIVSMSIC